jgi:hypothetical protein
VTATTDFWHPTGQQAGAVPLYRLWNRPFPIQEATGYDINWISYDTSNGTIQETSVDSIYSLKLTNDTAVQQTSELDGSQTVTDTTGWSNTITVKAGIKVSGGVNIPIVAEGKIELSAEVDYSYTWSGSKSIAKMWSWKQPVIVPAHTTEQATVAVSRPTVSVPYIMHGEFSFPDGQKIGGMQAGTYMGINSHDLAIVVTNITNALANRAEQPERLTPDGNQPLVSVLLEPQATVSRE